MLTVLACLIVADFLTGLVHWIEDTYGLPDWPWIGKLVIEPNIEHHHYPGRLGSMSVFLIRNYQVFVPCLFVAAAALLLGGWSAWPVVLTVAFAAMGNEVHTWNHRGQNPWPIRFLQDSGLVQDARHHAKHHRPPFNSHFCTLTNFTNELLELIRFWPAAEWLLRVAFGLTPKRMSEARGGV